MRSQRVGNACIWALGQRDESEAAAHLVNAKTRVKNGAIIKTLEKTIEVVAVRAQMSAADLEELAVPDYGLENGVLSHQFDSVTVQVEVVRGKATWRWESEGKVVKTAPAGVRRDFAAELKELKVTVAEIEKTLVAQKEGLDSLLRAEKHWDFATWKARYADHPLMQLLTCRLIWNFETEERKVIALPQEGRFVNAQGEAVSVAENARVSLYHPLFDSAENVMQWRRFFEEGAIKQPFKTSPPRNLSADRCRTGDANLLKSLCLAYFEAASIQLAVRSARLEEHAAFDG